MKRRVAGRAHGQRIPEAEKGGWRVPVKMASELWS